MIYNRFINKYGSKGNDFMIKFKYMDKELLYFDANNEIISLHRNSRIHLMGDKSPHSNKHYLYITSDDLMKQRDENFNKYLNKWLSMLIKLNIELNVSVYKGNIILFKQVEDFMFMFILHEEHQSATLYLINSINQNFLDTFMPKIKHMAEINEYNQIIKRFDCNNVTKMKYIISYIFLKLKNSNNIRNLNYIGNMLH